MKDLTKVILLALGIGAAIYAGLMVIGAVAMLILLSPEDRIREVYKSPEGKYQVEVVDSSAGAMDRGESYIAFEYANRKKAPASEGDKKPARAMKVDEINSHYQGYYQVSWRSENQFEVQWKKYNAEDKIFWARVTIHENGFDVLEGSLTVTRDKSFFNDYDIDGENVYIRCSICIENTADTPIEFNLSASSPDDYGKLLDNSGLEAVTSSNETEAFIIEAGSTQTIEVTFLGKKGPKDTKADRLLPKRIIIEQIKSP